MAALRDSGASVVTLVAKSHDRHVELALRTTLEENLAMIRDTVAHLREEGQTVFLDAEHFFDGYRSNRDYALEVLRTAHDAGAEVVALCDTNGGMLPGWVGDVVHDVLEAAQVRVGIHCHNDTGCAVANSLAAVEAGATHVQGTINGYGERTGNADLVAVVANLELKLDRQVLPAGLLRDATRIAHAVAEVTNVPPASRQPYVGTSAFAHKAGLHASAIKVDPNLYQHMDPVGVGNDMRLLVSDMAGRASIQLKSRELGFDLTDSAEDRELVTRVTDRVKALEARGHTFEAADASFELLLIEEVEGARPAYFDIESWRVITDSSPTGEAVSEATVKLRAQGVRYVVTGEGNGPVNALDAALRTAIGQAYPEVAKFELIDYKVRILDQGHGTDAITRVLIETSDGESTWVTVGVGANVIEASWGALTDGLTFGLRRHHLGLTTGAPGQVLPAVEDPVHVEPLDPDLLVEDRRLERGHQRRGEQGEVAGHAELGEQVAHVHRGEGVRRERPRAGPARVADQVGVAERHLQPGSPERRPAGPRPAPRAPAGAGRSAPRPATRSPSG